MIDNYYKKIYIFLILLDSKKFFLSIGISAISSCVPFSWLFFVILSYIFRIYSLNLIGITFSSFNLLSNLISGGFPAGLIFGISSLQINPNQLFISFFLLIFIMIYYSSLKIILPNTSFLMEIAICFLTARTCLGMLKC